jgi:hypothetical protein
MKSLNHANIFIDGNGDEAYEKEVLRLVNRILLTRTGQALAFLIRSHGSVFIRASDPKDANASTTGSRPTAYIDFYPNTTEQNTDVRLNVAGNMTLKVRTIRLNPGWEPGEVLFHELVHAARLLGNDDAPLSEEEFFAVLVANALNNLP